MLKLMLRLKRNLATYPSQIFRAVLRHLRPPSNSYLVMIEDFSEDNLISKTERFLSQLVLRNIKESVRTLKSCEALMPLAKELSIPQR
uniref:Uncharacterized protein n=1 Tax=Nelumbo nucifera TaxID=4432 RepID=A0A822ZCT1_NELNU|nr:TPA_asm: hypothetical protein HUJ06_013681 [Nelumbo nucifera]